MANFQPAVDKVLKREGGFSNNPNDRGKKTKYGITESVLAEAKSLGLIAPERTIETLTVPEAVLIYRKLYWDRMRLDTMTSQAIAGECFDTGVNGGLGTAGMILQRALQLWDRKIKLDGAIGPRTVALTNLVTASRKDEVLLYKLLNVLQGERYIEIALNDPTQMGFLRGWIDQRVSLDPGTEEK